MKLKESMNLILIPYTVATGNCSHWVDIAVGIRTKVASATALNCRGQTLSQQLEQNLYNIYNIYIYIYIDLYCYNVDFIYVLPKNKAQQAMFLLDLT